MLFFILQYSFAIFLFFFCIIAHELLHYIPAKQYGLDPKYKWVQAKEKHTYGIFGYLPGVNFNSYPPTLKQWKYITLSPVIPCTIIYFFLFATYFAEDIATDCGTPKLISFLSILISFSFLTSLMSSSADMKDYSYYKHFWQMRY